MKMRKNKNEYYLDIARSVASRSTCTRRKFGAIIVKDDSIVATGYNGTIRGALNCGNDISCLKDLYKEEHGTSYEYCPAVHAEENACLMAGRQLAIGGTMYIASLNGGMDAPCYKCRRKIVQVGIKTVKYRTSDGIVSISAQNDYVNWDDEWMMELYEAKKPNWVEEELEVEVD
jgi:dCMP deaminase